MEYLFLKLRSHSALTHHVYEHVSWSGFFDESFPAHSKITPRHTRVAGVSHNLIETLEAVKKEFDLSRRHKTVNQMWVSNSSYLHAVQCLPNVITAMHKPVNKF